MEDRPSWLIWTGGTVEEKIDQLFNAWEWKSMYITPWA